MAQNRPDGGGSLRRLACVLAVLGIVAARGQAQIASESVLHVFVNAPQGANPTSVPVRDSAGNLYGTTWYGGSGGEGVIYKLTPAGNVTVLYNFVGEAQQASTGVVLDPAGNLYGSTSTAVYKLDTAGNFTVISNPFEPSAVTRDAAGNLYWTTDAEGPCIAGHCGVIYKINPAGKLIVMHSFSQVHLSPGVTPDGAGNVYGATANMVFKVDAKRHFTALYTSENGGPEFSGGVVLDRDGNVYGVGSTSPGSLAALYKLDQSRNLTILYTFTGGADGNQPTALARDPAGNLYGTTITGGAPGCYGAGCGVVFKLDTAGNYTVLYSFTGAADGGTPWAGVLLDPAGALVGTTFNGGAEGWGVVFKLEGTGRETVLYSFRADGGAVANSGLVADSAGNLYGTTFAGGAFSHGLVYRLDTVGRYTVLYAFTGGADGSVPRAGVVLDSAGNLYGTTWQGGSAGYGVIFKLDPTGHETVLHTFTGGAGGGSPVAGVILDPQGNLYGNAGAIFKLDPAGNFTVLHTFTGGAGGSGAYAGVIRDPAGNLYGTTAYGGNLACQVTGVAGCGLVYKIDPAGNYTVLYSFAGGADGADPNFAGVVRDAAGNLYGTTQWGGNGNPGDGTVFKLDPSGHETVVHRFTGYDGFQPAGISLDAGGLYGTTWYGGPTNVTCGLYGCGVVFSLDAAGQFTVLYNFTGAADGANPLAGLVRDPTGSLFGTYGYGSSTSYPTWIGGGVFELKPQ